MAVETTVTSASSIGNGVSTVFPLPFVFLDNSHIKLYLDGVLQGSGYVVSGAGVPTGGSITITPAPAYGVVVLRVREVPITQEVDTVNNETILQDVLDKALDKLTMICQQIYGSVVANLDRAFKVPEGESAGTVPAAATRRNKLALFDDTAAAPLTAISFPDLAQYFKGDPGGNAMAVGPLLTVPGLHIPLGTDVIRTSGYALSGDDGGDCWERLASEPVHAAKVKDANNYWWQPVAQVAVNAHAVGVKADGTYNNATGVMTGTDSRAAMQTAIDYGVYFAKKPIWYAGIIRTGAPLHLGYGQEKLPGHLFGVGKTIAPEQVGSTILCDFDHGMAVNVQGGLGSTIKGISVVGRNYVWPATNKLAMVAELPINGKDDRVMSDWIDSLLPATANAQHTPYAAFVIDGYSGAAPGAPYPVVDYPAWTGIVAQYGKLASSDVLIEECAGFGFVGFLAIQPGADGNGDFIKVRSCHGERFAWIYSAGNTQGRNFGATDNNWNSCHTGYVTGLHGTQSGKFGGVSTNEHFGQNIQVVSAANDSIAGPLRFVSTYGEECWRLGDYGGNAASGSGITWESPLFSFGLQGAHDRGVPATLLGGLFPSQCARNISGGAFQVFDLCPLGDKVENWTIQGLQIGYLEDVALTETYQQIARNYLAGGVVFQLNSPYGGGWPASFSVKCIDTYNLTTGLTVGAQVYNGECASDRSRGICAWSRNAYNIATPGETTRPAPPQDSYMDLGYAGAGGIVSAVFATTGILTVTFNSRTEADFNHKGGLPGDLLQIGNTIFKVYSRIGQVVLARISNNYQVVAGVYSVLGDPGTLATGKAGGEAVVYDSGRLGVFNARRFLPIYYTHVTMESTGAPTVLNHAGRGDGDGAYLTTEVLADDWLYINDLVDRWTAPASSKIAGVNGGANTITLTGAALKDRVEFPLPFVCRQPPANI